MQVETMPLEAPPQVEVQPLGQLPISLPPLTEKPEPHIALLLPIKSAAFGASADAVHLGFLAAAGSQRHALPIKVYGSFDEGKDIVTLYKLATSNGAVAVAGPLTRDGVAALATQADITVPTLALNLVEGKSADKLYFFGLSAEAEARQVAQLARAAKLRYATIVSTDTPLTKRLVLAFEEEWQALGGSITAEVLFANNPAVLALLPTAPGDPVPSPSPPPLTASGQVDPNFIAPPIIAPGNMVFLAADAEKARLIRPYLNAALPVYSTSQLFNSNADALTNYDLNDIRFVDMPWLLQPDHPAVMIYLRPTVPMEPDKERLYALGIDAFRLLQMLLDNTHLMALPLDGVSGRIFLNDHQFHREGLPAQIRQGRAQLNLTDPAPPKPLKPTFPKMATPAP